MRFRRLRCTILSRSFNRGRFFCQDAEVRRFISVDDASYLGADGTIDGYNLYAYCDGNPIALIDVDGHDPSLVLEWTSLTWWLPVVDGPLPVGDIIFCGGTAIIAIYVVTDEKINVQLSKHKSGNKNKGKTKSDNDSGNKKGVGGKGWRGDKNWKQDVNEVGKGGTIQDLNGQVPTQQEAIDLINESGGTVDRIEGPHKAPNPHNYNHINYTTPSGGKGTIRIK